MGGVGGGGGGGVGWGGMITFMFLCTHRHSNLIIFLAVAKRQAQLFHDQLPVGWGELIRFMWGERTWVKFSARTRKQLHQMPHESSS